MRYGFVIPQGEIHEIAELAHEAEESGWDGVFYWDGIYIQGWNEIYDPWVTLAAMALRTERVRLGAMLTPPARRRPWKLARETVSVDRLSNGRLVLPVGLGTVDDGGFSLVGEPTDRRTRAELLDESLAILTGLWSGEPFAYHGRHYQMETMTFRPTPVQRPRIPIWVVGAWPRAKSMARALRYDGLLPYKLNPDGSGAEIAPADIAAMRDYIAEQRQETTPYDIVWEGRTPGDDPAAAAAQLRPFVEAGLTWWIEAMWSAPNDVADIRLRIRQGPPRVEA
ncbi:MAG TPA: LLM class flavin-dependent oxidoreductase, partial [Ktedonobacterales bacterium]|nr:LLM class flavin-dependent oxidoreductase [Ktedonobacterales bacterium]